MLEYGRTGAMLFHLGFDQQRRVLCDALTDTAVETSAIEGEALRIASVRASLARHLHMPLLDVAPTDARADGIVAMTVDAVQRADRNLFRTPNVCDPRFTSKHRQARASTPR